ncbi:MAG: Asd/ArgC dimerization domain-containing protein, partial [Spirochaetaceae bacterium]|nr:Asd/ArgC dimerization domain-containing protein [Spirochaetaceae bacterium]
FIITKPNCGVQGYVMALAALQKAGFKVNNVITTNLQALSGAGYPGQSAMDVIDNIIALPSEEEKAFVEPQKIFGHVKDAEIVPLEDLKISSNCIRVPVVHGHSSAVWFDIQGMQPELEALKLAFMNFQGEPQRLNLPSAPKRVIRYFDGDIHPQPRLDRDAEGGMAVTLGRLQKSPVLGYRFTCMAHNTRRGAAGGGVLTAELLVSKGFIN